MAKKQPTLQPWIKWWDARCSNIFAPLWGAGLPGMNLSEMGNAGWKPHSTLRLVHAAKQDVASMMLQERRFSCSTEIWQSPQKETPVKQ